MLLTLDEIVDINQNAEFDSAIGYARKIESAVLEKLKAQEPYVIEYPDYHQHGMGCGLEDRDIIDRYEAMAYGWDCAIDAMAECIPDRLYEHPLPPADVVRDPRVAELEAVLLECREVLMHYQYGGSSYKEPADKAIAKIDEVLK